MTMKMRSALPVLAACLLISFYSTSTNAGKPNPEPSLCIPVEKTFYLTTDNYAPSDALTACAEGYHFATFAEFMDIGGMTYNNDLGVDDFISGFGPPISLGGWVRYGADGSTGSCSGWISNNEAHNGPLMTIGDISIPGVEPYPRLGFQLSDATCNHIARVWCISDPVY